MPAPKNNKHALKHGAFKSPRKDTRHLKRKLEASRLAIMDDLGGPDHVTVKESIQIDNAVRLLRILHYIDKYLQSRDIIKDGELIKVLSNNYVAYINALSRVLQSLGLNKRVIEKPLNYLDIAKQGKDNE